MFSSGQRFVSFVGRSVVVLLLDTLGLPVKAFSVLTVVVVLLVVDEDCFTLVDASVTISVGICLLETDGALAVVAILCPSVLPGACAVVGTVVLPAT